MQKLEAPNSETQSAEIVASNIVQLKALFPEVFIEGKIDFGVLRQLLGGTLEEAEEKYGINWRGKRHARQMALTPSMGTLRPCPEESVDWDATQNLVIEGDNLEVLKLLRKSYARSIRLIYIDPPYNTGKDFVYPDNFQDNIKNYLEITGQADADGRKFSSNTESSGRFHTDWMNMMYPRLKLARDLLKDDGVIFISIDDKEVAGLRKICDEIFGEENFLGCACRVTKKANNQGDYWSPNFDYLLTYSKSRPDCLPFFGGINLDSYDEVENEGPRTGEKYQLVRLYMTSLDPMRGCTNQRYYIEAPDGTLLIPPGKSFPEKQADGESVPPGTEEDKVWRWTKTKYLDEKDRIAIRKVRSSNLINEHGGEVKWNVFTKTYLNDVIKNASAKPNSLIEQHINQNSSHELNDLDVKFSFAKPSSLIKYLCEISRIGKDDLVLDFFAGSGSTAQAVLDLNELEGTSRRFLLVQIPEPLDPSESDQKAGSDFCDSIGKPRTISEITKERVRRVGQKIKSEREGKLDLWDKPLDVGFRVFKLDSSNIRTWEPNHGKLSQSLFDAAEHIKNGRSEQDILFELLLKLGLDLTVPIDQKTLAGKIVHSIGAGVLIVCLASQIDATEVEVLAMGIVEWLKELNPAGESQLVFRDSAFANDVAKTNLAAIFQQHGLENVRSL